MIDSDKDFVLTISSSWNLALCLLVALFFFSGCSNLLTKKTAEKIVKEEVRNQKSEEASRKDVNELAENRDVSRAGAEGAKPLSEQNNNGVSEEYVIEGIAENTEKESEAIDGKSQSTIPAGRIANNIISEVEHTTDTYGGISLVSLGVGGDKEMESVAAQSDVVEQSSYDAVQEEGKEGNF